jgi:hypothetical protein
MATVPVFPREGQRRWFSPGWKPDAGNSFGYQLIRAFAKTESESETYNEQEPWSPSYHQI